jgi:hypothetical protein
MNVKELYDHILKHMTAEQALMKMLEGTVIEYQKLKFSEEGKEIHPEMLIVMAVLDRGWNMAIPDPKGNPDGELPGMIVGTQEYIDDVLGKNDDFRDKDEN